MALNENLEFAELAPGIQASFANGEATKQLFPAGHELFAFRTTDQANSVRCPEWWSSVNPLAVNDLGFEQTLARGGRMASRYTRGLGRSGGSASNGLFLGALSINAYGFFGSISSQRINSIPDQFRIFYVSGGVQVWIPNLAPTHLRALELAS